MNYGSSISRTAAGPGQNRSPLYLLACGRLRFILYRLCRFIKKDADLSPSPGGRRVPVIIRAGPPGFSTICQKTRPPKPAGSRKSARAQKPARPPMPARPLRFPGLPAPALPSPPRKPCTAMVHPSSVWRCLISITCRTPKISSRKPCSAFSPPPVL